MTLGIHIKSLLQNHNNEKKFLIMSFDCNTQMQTE